MRLRNLLPLIAAEGYLFGHPDSRPLPHEMAWDVVQACREFVEELEMRETDIKRLVMALDTACCVIGREPSGDADTVRACFQEFREWLEP